MRHLIAIVTILAFLWILGIAGQAEYERESSQAFNFVGEDVRAHVTPELTFAVCGAYAKLRIYEDHTYDCLPA